MLLALAGLAGAGKTTAIAKLEELSFGRRFYVGQVIQDEVEQRGLDLSADNERKIRTELREIHGMDVCARIALPQLEELLEKGPVLLDAICCMDELDYYRSTLASRLKVLAVSASLENRANRLALRPERPMTRDELARRDELELDGFKLGDVLASSDFTVLNDGSLDELEKSLFGLIASFGD